MDLPSGICNEIGNIGLDTGSYDIHRAAVLANKKKTRAIRTQQRALTARAASERELEALLPSSIPPGDSWHVISAGDVDSLSYLSHLLQSTSADYVLISTWCMAQPDVDALEHWLNAGTIARLDAYVGEIFPVQYPGPHSNLCRIAGQGGGQGGGVPQPQQNHARVQHQQR